jgi:hypothetical protein
MRALVTSPRYMGSVSNDGCCIPNQTLRGQVSTLLARLTALWVLNLSASHSATRCSGCIYGTLPDNLFGVTSLPFLSLHTNSYLRRAPSSS